jgi:hypothetical protein
MASKSESNPESLPFLPIGKEQTEAMLEMQKEVLKAYEEAGQAWLERMKAEVALWSDLASKLSASRSMPDGLQAYRDTFAQRVQMAADDGRRLFEESQKIIASISRTMPGGGPKQSS